MEDEPPEYRKNSCNLISTGLITQLKKWAKNMKRYFSNEDMQMTNKHMKRRSSSLAIRKMQIKITIRYHFTLTRMAIIRMTDNNECH
jgi:hypothetical protein